jgi:hypothetical protein
VPLNAVECWVTKHDHRSQVGLMNHGNWAACADWWATKRRHRLSLRGPLTAVGSNRQAYTVFL